MSQAQSTRAATGALACALCLLSGACFGLTENLDEGDSCRNDGDCQEACSPIGECILNATALDIRVNWTINGVAPSPQNRTPCGAITDFEVRFESESIRDDAFAFFPVPCENGTVFYPQMPSRLVQMTLTGVNEFGDAIAQDARQIVDSNSVFAIDLSL